MNNKLTVLITNGSYQNALAATRSLGRAGFRVWVADKRSWSHRFGMAGLSRYCVGQGWYTDPRESFDAFIEDILKLIDKSKADVLLPIGVDTNVAVAAEQDKLRPFVSLALPAYQDFLKAHDKDTATNLARVVGVPVPRSVRVESLKHLHKLAEEYEYPVVLKARKSSSASGVWFAHNFSELECFYTRMLEHQEGHWKHKSIATTEYPILQEYIPGKIHDVCTISNHGEVCASLTQIRLRMFPLNGGSGIFNETTDIPLLCDYSKAILKALNWHGVAQVEFKWDTRDNIPKFIEVNPKFWGTLALSIEAGVDFPVLACKLALEDRVQAVSDYRVGQCYRWALPHEVELAIQSKDKKAGFGELWSALTTNAATDFQKDDPLPTLSLLANTGRRALLELYRSLKQG